MKSSPLNLRVLYSVIFSPFFSVLLLLLGVVQTVQECRFGRACREFIDLGTELVATSPFILGAFSDRILLVFIRLAGL